MGKTGSCSGGLALLSKALIQLSADGWSCASWYLFGLVDLALGSAGSVVGLMANPKRFIPRGTF